MQLSKEDLFFDAENIGTDGVESDILDFGKHGDDVMGNLFWFVHTTGFGPHSVRWYTCDSDDNDDHWTQIGNFSVIMEEGGGYVVKNAPLPKGLKRYNRLSCTVSGAGGGIITAGLTTGRDEGVPYTGEA